MQTVAHKAQAKDVYKLDMSLILPYESNQLLCTLVCYKTCVKPLYCVCVKAAKVSTRTNFALVPYV